MAKTVKNKDASTRGQWCITSTAFAVHQENVHIHLRGTATNSAKMHSLAPKNEHLRLNQIQ